MVAGEPLPPEIIGDATGAVPVFSVRHIQIAPPKMSAAVSPKMAIVTMVNRVVGVAAAGGTGDGRGVVDQECAVGVCGTGAFRGAFAGVDAGGTNGSFTRRRASSIKLMGASLLCQDTNTSPASS